MTTRNELTEADPAGPYYCDPGDGTTDFLVYWDGSKLRWPNVKRGSSLAMHEFTNYRRLVVEGPPPPAPPPPCKCATPTKRWSSDLCECQRRAG